MDFNGDFQKMRAKFAGGDITGFDPGPLQNMQAVPFYQAYPMAGMYMDVLEDENDMIQMKSMYPSIARTISPYIEEECDKMEYDGSLMFDFYPDKILIRQICNHIYEKVKYLEDTTEESSEDTADIYTMAYAPAKYKKDKNWIQELIEVMLYQEMYQRRCRRRKCKSRFY